MEPPAAVPRTSTWRQVKTLLLREHVLGLIVYVTSVPERAGNALIGLTLLACALLWSARDGVLPRAGQASACVVFVESTLLYVGAVMVANMLRLAFGQMPAP